MSEIQRKYVEQVGFIHARALDGAILSHLASGCNLAGIERLEYTGLDSPSTYRCQSCKESLLTISPPQLTGTKN